MIKIKLIWKGKFTSTEQLSIGNLPENAVKFKEPDSLVKMNLIASLFIIPVIIIMFLSLYIKKSLGASGILFSGFNNYGILLSFLAVIPHEILHGISFPKEAEVEFWYSLKSITPFVTSTHPTSKRRFIFISLLPSLIFGIIPILIWMFIPSQYAGTADMVFSFAIFSLFLGCGDFLNVFNAMRQMPKNSYTQLSGMNSYWYFKDDKKVA